MGIVAVMLAMLVLTRSYAHYAPPSPSREPSTISALLTPGHAALISPLTPVALRRSQRTIKDRKKSKTHNPNTSSRSNKVNHANANVARHVSTSKSSGSSSEVLQQEREEVNVSPEVKEQLLVVRSLQKELERDQKKREEEWIGDWSENWEDEHANPAPPADMLEIVTPENRRHNPPLMLPRHTVHSKGLHHRAVNVLVFNSIGALLLQKRSPQKDMSPMLYDISCAEHVNSGETYKDAVIRGLYEELGIDLSKKELQEKVKLTKLSRRPYLSEYTKVIEGEVVKKDVEWQETWAIKWDYDTRLWGDGEVERLQWSLLTTIGRDVAVAPESYTQRLAEIRGTFLSGRVATTGF